MTSPIVDEAEAQDMLARLRVHYKQPVLPVSHFCKSVEAWMHAIQANNQRPVAERSAWDTRENRHGSAYHDHLGHILTDIHKSALLYRLLYLGQPLRTVECPKHRGELEMGEWIGDITRGPKCEHGCGGTGWLP